MNIYTKNITSLLKITLEEASKVQDQMERNGIDFSECSVRAFNKEARLAAQEISSALLTTEQMISIMTKGTIKECSEKHKRQVMAFAFGSDFIESDNKGNIAIY